MRDLNELDGYRVRSQQVLDHWGWFGDGTCGMFSIPSPIDGQPIKVIASSAECLDTGWDHVSVSRAKLCPNWQEMSHIARLFFKPDEMAMQLSVPESEHLSLHPHCLHWWRPTKEQIPKPPSNMVAVPGGLEENRRYLDSIAPLKSTTKPVDAPLDMSP